MQYQEKRTGNMSYLYPARKSVIEKIINTTFAAIIGFGYIYLLAQAVRIII